MPREDNPTLDEGVFSVAEYIALLNVKIKSLKATIQGELGKISYYPRAVYFSLKVPAAGKTLKLDSPFYNKLPPPPASIISDSGALLSRPVPVL
jgi:hypothetical protein